MCRITIIKSKKKTLKGSKKISSVNICSISDRGTYFMFYRMLGWLSEGLKHSGGCMGVLI